MTPQELCEAILDTIDQIEAFMKSPECNTHEAYVANVQVIGALMLLAKRIHPSVAIKQGDAS